MILPIYTYGQPVLRKEAQDITPDYPELKKFIEDMWETLAESEGIGLAAPQAGKSIQLVVIDLQQKESEEQVFLDGRSLPIALVQPLFLVNPTWRPAFP